MSLYNDASLVMIPSAYKDGKLYSIKPTDGSGDFTFSRGSNLAATRVDVNGLIEKGRENLLLQSNQFDTTWITSNTSVTSGQSGYDGTNDAWLFTTTIAGATLTQSITASGVVVFSMYAKKGTVDGIRLRIDAATDADAYFNLFNGSVHSFTGSAIDASMISLGSGWYRCQISANISSPVKVAFYTTDGTTAYDNGHIYIQDAQLEYGLVATDYIETTTTTAQAGILEDMPRLDYSGSCPSLLLEPTRTNILTYSEYFEPAVYGKINLSITTNTGVSLEGFENASLVIPNAALGDRYLTNSTNSGLSTSSLFFKKKELRYAKFGNAQSAVVIDLESGTLSAESISTNFFSIKDYGNGWYRVSCYNSLSTNLQLQLFAGIDANGNNIATNGTDGFYIYGFQLESGSYPTSYIPTYGSSVTFLKDEAYNLSASDLIGNNEGVIFIDVKTPSVIESNTAFSIGGGTFNEYAQLEIRSDLSINWRYRQGGTDYINANVGSYVAGDRLKLAFAYKNGDSILYKNGSSIATYTGSINSNTWDEIRFSNFAGTGNLNASVKQVRLCETRLSNTELETLTTI